MRSVAIQLNLVINADRSCSRETCCAEPCAMINKMQIRVHLKTVIYILHLMIVNTMSSNISSDFSHGFSFCSNHIFRWFTTSLLFCSVLVNWIVTFSLLFVYFKWSKMKTTNSLLRTTASRCTLRNFCIPPWGPMTLQVYGRSPDTDTTGLS